MNLMTQENYVFITLTFVDNFDGRAEAANDYSLHTQIAPACQLFHSKPTMTTLFRLIDKQKNEQNEIYVVSWDISSKWIHQNYLQIHFVLRNPNYPNWDLHISFPQIILMSFISPSRYILVPMIQSL